MDSEKRTPLRLQILIFLVYTVTGLALVIFLFLPLVMYLLLPNVVKLFPDGKTDLAVWMLLGLFAALFVWAVSLLLRKKHRFLAVFLALLAVFSAIKSLPYFDYDRPDPVLQPELVASYHTDDGNKGDVKICWSSFFVGSSMHSVPYYGADLGLSEKDQAELKDLTSDHSYTWIVTSGQTVSSVSWSCRSFMHYQLPPWNTGAVYPADFMFDPADENTVYVYRIPLAHIDDIF